MKKNYIPSTILEKIKNDVKLELSINYSDNNEVSNNLVENSVESQSLQSLPNHNEIMTLSVIKVIQHQTTRYKTT
jgi:hypothetical protein